MVDYYHEPLIQSPEALKYLLSRSLDYSEMAAHFRVGFSNRTLGYRLPEKNRKNGAEIRGRLQKLGLLRESGHEHFTGSVVFPVIDLNGNVTEMYGCKITPNLRTGTPLHTYLPGPHKGVWNEEALTVSKEIILCESIIDASTSWCADYRHVTASYGINGFTPDHRAAFQKHGVKKVLIAYDRDDAGDKAAGTLADELIAMGIDSYRVLFPKGMDANRYGCHVKPTAKSLGVTLNSAKWIGKGKPPAVVSVVVKAPDPTPLPPEPEPAAKEEETEPVLSLAAGSVPAAPPPKPEPAAVPRPQPSTIDIPVEIKGVFQQGDRRYRVRGLAKNMSHEVLTA